METITSLMKNYRKIKLNKENLRLVIRRWWKGLGDPADINDDDRVNRKDLFAVIRGWGRCPQ